ncbi:MAG: hypothetical protein GYA24_18410 [Candidatus Lokiarchaeota archaeon]|nr:hypothetical protein [Candidatus Lokiarchaeota archaeon]
MFLLYRAFKCKENPLDMLNPVSWLRETGYERFSSCPRPVKESIAILAAACIGLVAFEVASVVLGDLISIF